MSNNPLDDDYDEDYGEYARRIGLPETFARARETNKLAQALLARDALPPTPPTPWWKKMIGL